MQRLVPEEGELELRTGVLRSCGARGAALPELLRYTRTTFTPPAAADALRLPLPDEPSVAAWEGYASESAGAGVLEVLRGRLAQLEFPIAAGISETEEYRAATRRGEPRAAGAPRLALRAPGRLELRIHPTPAGRIPVLIAGEREDFVSLVRALTRRNEPAAIPASMGACIVAGYNNWDRIRALRARWEWGDVAARKELYQDVFILLSRGPYSAARAAEVGLPAHVWEEASLVLRLEHECAHYFTRRIFGSMRNSLHDELIADFAGITAAAGHFRSDWLLRFMGLEAFPRYREDGRLQSYRGDPPLSAGAFAVLRSLLKRVAESLEELHSRGALPMHRAEERAATLCALASVPLEALASPDAGARLSPPRAPAAPPPGEIRNSCR